MGLLLSLVGLAGGFAAGAWLVLVVDALLDGRWSALASMPIEYHLFPASPGLIAFIGGNCGGLAGVVLAKHCLRYLVVSRWRWMSADEFEAMLKRDPGF